MHTVHYWRQKVLKLSNEPYVKVRLLVNLVEDWESLEEYAHRCKYGAFQVRKVVDGVEVRVVVGKFGFVKTFQNSEDDLLKRILSFCSIEGFIKVLGSISDELFFT